MTGRKRCTERRVRDVSGNVKALLIGMALGLVFVVFTYACNPNTCKGSSNTNCYIYVP